MGFGTFSPVEFPTKKWLATIGTGTFEPQNEQIITGSPRGSTLSLEYCTIFG